jgi:Tfp pilus assembly protein PilV
MLIEAGARSSQTQTQTSTAGALQEMSGWAYHCTTLVVAAPNYVAF